MNKLLILTVVYFAVYYPAYGQKLHDIKESYSIDTEIYGRIKDSLFSNAVSVLKYLPPNCDRLGNTDYTNYIQQAISENKTLIFPGFPILISPNSIRLHDSSRLFFEKGSELRIRSNSLSSYYGILIAKNKDIQLYFVNIVGDRDSHRNNKGQWGHGIIIRSSSNISLIYPKITNCWGDGLYIGNNGKPYNENITINYGYFDYNRRNGISIISGRNIYILNTYIANTKGHSPESGIDIEPNSNSNIIDNIVIRNVTTFRNAARGLIISTGNIIGSVDKRIRVSVTNFTDYGAKVGIGVAITRSKKPDYGGSLTGEVSISNVRYYNNSEAAIRNKKGIKSDVMLDVSEQSIFKNGIKMEVSKSKEMINRLLNSYKTQQTFDIK